MLENKQSIFHDRLVSKCCYHECIKILNILLVNIDKTHLATVLSLYKYKLYNHITISTTKPGADLPYKSPGARPPPLFALICKTKKINLRPPVQPNN